MDHPTPRAFPGRFVSYVVRPSGNLSGFVPIHSGGSVPESHRLPFSAQRSHPMPTNQLAFIFYPFRRVLSTKRSGIRTCPTLSFCRPSPASPASLPFCGGLFLSPRGSSGGTGSSPRGPATCRMTRGSGRFFFASLVSPAHLGGPCAAPG